LKSSTISLEQPLSELEYHRLPLARPDARAPELIEKMLMHGTNKVLIATEDGKFVGIVTLLDLIPDAKQVEPDSPAPVPRISG
jgi:CBS domain containing-hemolysin-like protein